MASSRLTCCGMDQAIAVPGETRKVSRLLLRELTLKRRNLKKHLL